MYVIAQLSEVLAREDEVHPVLPELREHVRETLGSEGLEFVQVDVEVQDWVNAINKRTKSAAAESNRTQAAQRCASEPIAAA